MPSFKSIYLDEGNTRKNYAVNLTPFELFRLNVVAEFNKCGMECEMYKNNNVKSLSVPVNSDFRFKLNEVIMICDKESVEFAIAGMLDYAIDHDSDKYDTLLTFLQPYENEEFFSTEEVVEFFKKHDLHLYFNFKFRPSIKLGIFEHLKGFDDF